MRPVRASSLAAVVVASVLTVVGCGASGDDTDAAAPTAPESAAAAEPAVSSVAPDQTLAFVAHDFSFEGPTEATAGLAELTLTNAGAEDHQLGLFRLNEGVEPGVVLAALGAAGHLEAGREYGEWIAGPNGAAPAASATVITHLEPGRYIVGCLIPSPDGTPHAMKGMLSELTVTPAVTETAPRNDAALPVVTLAEYHIELPADFGTGSVTIRNAGEEVHEFLIAELADGATVQDVIAYESAPRPRTPAQPYTMVTGTSFIDPGGEGRLDLDLEAGEYVAICFIPAPTGEAHFALGMVHPFTVD